MKTIQVPSDAVLVVLGRARPEGPQIDCNINTEWWEAASKEHRRSLFTSTIEAIGELGGQVIPEEFEGQPLALGSKMRQEFDAAQRLLAATVAVRRAIDKECGPQGTFTSEDPEYDRKMALFDQLHHEEAEAWEAYKPYVANTDQSATELG